MRHLLAVVALAVVAVVAATPVHAQRLGVDMGLSGVENSDPFNPSLGATLELPAGAWLARTLPALERLSLAGSIVTWRDPDGNQAYYLDYGNPDSFAREGRAYGQWAVSALGMVRVAGDRQSRARLGVGYGVAWQQKLRYPGDGTDVPYWERRAALAAELTVGRGRLVPYLRADLASPGAHARAGISARFF